MHVVNMFMESGHRDGQCGVIRRWSGISLKGCGGEGRDVERGVRER